MVADIVICLIVLVGIFFAIKSLRKDKKKGGCAGCSGCSGCHSCSSQPNVDENKK